MKKQIKKTTLDRISIRNVDPELFHQARIAALEANITLGKWLHDAIKEKLEKED